MRSVLMITLLLLSSTVLQAQEQIEMADTMRAEGKIYVVVAILVLILVGIIGYLISLDRKVGKLERRLEDKK